MSRGSLASGDSKTGELATYREKGFKMNGKDCENSFERLMNQNGNSDRLREAFLQELLKSEWKEQVDVVNVHFGKRRWKIRNLIPFPLL